MANIVTGLQHILCLPQGSSHLNTLHRASEEFGSAAIVAIEELLVPELSGSISRTGLICRELPGTHHSCQAPAAAASCNSDRAESFLSKPSRAHCFRTPMTNTQDCEGFVWLHDFSLGGRKGLSKNDLSMQT